MRAQVDLYQRGPLDQSRKVSRIGCVLWPLYLISRIPAQWPAFLAEKKQKGLRSNQEEKKLLSKTSKICSV